MRKIIVIVSITIAILVALIWPYIVLTPKSCYLGDLNLNVKVPGTALLLTRSSDRAGLPIDLYKMFKQTDIDQEFKKAGIYLQAKYSDFEIQIDSFADFGTATLFDLDRLTNEQLQEVLQSFAEQYQGQQVSLYKSPTTSYIVIEYTNKKLADTPTIKAYMTIKNGKLISIALLSNDKQAVGTRLDKLQQVVDSIQYSK